MASRGGVQPQNGDKVFIVSNRVAVLGGDVGRRPRLRDSRHRTTIHVNANQSYVANLLCRTRQSL